MILNKIKTFKIISEAIFVFVFLASCSNEGKPETGKQTIEAHGEYIYRLSNEHFFFIEQPEKKALEPYPWEKTLVGNLPKLTKEYFRCKGSTQNPVKTFQQKTEIQHCTDCGGADKHSLPLREGKEFIYPILIDLLKHIQSKTGKRVVITSGHRCPEHNQYVNPLPSNQYSKHMIGAEVSFYVQGMEDLPENIVKIIQDYYTVNSKYAGKKEFIEFKRYEKNDSNVSLLPWYNKEIFIKLFNKKKEGTLIIDIPILI